VGVVCTDGVRGIGHKRWLTAAIAVLCIQVFIEYGGRGSRLVGGRVDGRLSARSPAENSSITGKAGGELLLQVVGQLWVEDWPSAGCGGVGEVSVPKGEGLVLRGRQDRLLRWGWMKL